MDNLYKKYIKEREGKEVISNEEGFIIYLDLPEQNSLYLVEMFIDKPYRKSGSARKLYNQLEKIVHDKQYNKIVSSVDISTTGWKYSKKILECEGYQEVDKDGTLLYLIKEIHYGK